MTQTRNSKRPAAGAPVAKLAITAASVAAVLGGWAVFSAPDYPVANAGQVVEQLAAEWNLPAIPTLVAPPDGWQLPSHSRRQPAASQPPASQSDFQGLRSVSPFSPSPLTTTRSSR